MNTLEKIELSLFQIKNILLDNEKVRKLLYNATKNALEIETPDRELVEDLITLTPIIEDENGISKSYKNIFIAIYLGQILFDETENIVTLSIAIYSNRSSFELNDNKFRNLSILNEVVKELDTKKLTFAGKINIINAITENIEKGKYSGLVTTWEIVDNANI